MNIPLTSLPPRLAEEVPGDCKRLLLLLIKCLINNFFKFYGYKKLIEEIQYK